MVVVLPEKVSHDHQKLIRAIGPGIF